MRERAAAVPLAAALVLLTACGGSAVTRGRLESALGTTFGNLYAGGVPGLSPLAVGASASCDRGGPGVADEGAGDNWACRLRWVDVSGRLQQAGYGLQVRPDGCWKAEAEAGPGAAAAPKAFDGCTGAG